MSRHPFDSSELGRNDPELDRVGDGLERYASDIGGEPPLDLAARIHAAVANEPVRRRPLAAILGGWGRPVRLLAAAVVLLTAIVGALALGELSDRARQNTGSSGSPNPSVVVTPTPTPTAASSPSPSPTTTPSASPTDTPVPTASPPALPTDSPVPTATDDEGGGESETPRPSESDNSGPGGG